ncbi:polyadenylate-binding protein-interacting protein 1 isoform X2 [Cephus cinctus]|uniref:Polyadenylate-binding protein-interacting protein 1 isoform X2 n=1 Tax=Cephus cinctus TaxID=211228 RepID=A0AAJ7C268_CEPCN|nr:polyadenylate-binding protein-interacting protein 1 isoform X2 [Cephus cinctus]
MSVSCVLIGYFGKNSTLQRELDPSSSSATGLTLEGKAASDFLEISREMDPAGGVGSGDADGDRRGAGRGRGRGCWTQNTQEHQQLRRPRQAALGNQSIGSVNDMVKNSTLSVDAAEFVPKNYSNPPQGTDGSWQRPSVQNRLQLARQPGACPQTNQMMMPQRQVMHHQQQSHYGGQRQQHYPQQQHHQQQFQYQQNAEIPQQQQHQHQRYNQYSNARDYGHYDGGSGDYNNRHQSAPGRENNDHGTDLASTLRQLDNAMRSLTLNPGRFDSLVAPLVDTISLYLENPSQAQEIIAAIIQQSINEGNFRYSGARLCTHLDTVTAPTDRVTSTVRDTLYSRCRKESEACSRAWISEEEHSPNVEKKCHGLILFLAELVAQMEPDPASELGKMLVDLISVVLKSPAPNSAKHICQALKLAGHTLERDSSNNRREVERVMRSLTDLVTNGLVDQHVGRMVHSVHQLRSSHWGRIAGHRPLPMEMNQSSTTPQAPDEPVLYGPDGNVLSPEESRFLQDLAEEAAGPEEFGEAENEDCEEQLWEEDEDDVIAAAYEEFLKLGPNKNDGRARR